MSVLNQAFTVQAVDLDDIEEFSPVTPAHALVSAIALLGGNVDPVILVRDGLGFKAIARHEVIESARQAGMEHVNAIIAKDANVATALLQQIR